MLYIRLFYRFFTTGLFAIGGGLATLPFLYEMSADTGWFTTHDISNMIAVSESTPGAIGINMSTYVGYQTGINNFGVAGAILGAVVATFALIFPSIIIIELISKILTKFKESILVKEIFYGLRPASTALIAAAGTGVAKTTFLSGTAISPDLISIISFFDWKSIALGAALFAGIKLFKFHPVVYIAIAAVIGIIFQF